MHVIQSQAEEIYKQGQCTGPEKKCEPDRWKEGVGAALLAYLLLHVSVRDGTRRSVEEVLIGLDLSRLHLSCVAHLRTRQAWNYNEKSCIQFYYITHYCVLEFTCMTQFVILVSMLSC